MFINTASNSYFLVMFFLDFDDFNISEKLFMTRTYRSNKTACTFCTLCT